MDELDVGFLDVSNLSEDIIDCSISTRRSVSDTESEIEQFEYVIQLRPDGSPKTPIATQNRIHQTQMGTTPSSDDSFVSDVIEVHDQSISTSSVTERAVNPPLSPYLLPPKKVALAPPSFLPLLKSQEETN